MTNPPNDKDMRRLLSVIVSHNDQDAAAHDELFVQMFEHDTECLWNTISKVHEMAHSEDPVENYVGRLAALSLRTLWVRFAEKEME